MISGGAGVGNTALTFNGIGGGTIDITGTANTFSGNINVNGSEVRFTADGSFGNSANTVTIDGGRFATASGATFTLATTRSIAVGSLTGTSISTPGAGVLTYDGVISNKSGSTGILVKQGGGTLSFGGVSTYSGATSINNGILRLTTGNNRLPVGTTLNLGQAASANLGIFDLNGFNQQIAGLGTTAGTGTTGTNSVTSASAATLTISGTSSNTFGTSTAANNGIIIGAVSIVKAGSGTQTFGGTAAYTYTGTTTITDGVLQLGNANVLPITTAITLNGGTFRTGASTGFNQTVGTLNLNASSTIALGTGSHSLSFAASNGLTWNGSSLTITGWVGTAGASGTAGKVFVGNSASGLTAAQLAKITFDGFPAGATQLSTGEVVPAAASNTPTLAVSPSTLSLGSTVLGTPSSPQTYTLSASSLTATVGIVAPTGVEVGTAVGGPYSASISLPASTTSATVYVRLDATAAITVDNSITNSSGSSASATVTVSGTVLASAPPSITVANTTTAYLSASAVSGVISDPTDPASTLGIDFTIADADTPVGNLSVTASSSNVAVVPNANLALSISGAGASYNLKITPTGVGYSTVVVAVTDGVNTSSYSISYAASAVSTTTSRFHTGASDASTTQAVDADYMFVADDENQGLRLYNRQNSGLPVATFDFTSSLALLDLNNGVPREVDIEGSVRVGSRIYWIGSHSNSASGNNRPNRSRFFATNLSGTGALTTLTYVGRYDGLKTDLVSWDVNNTHGLGANFFGLSASTQSGNAPEAAGGVGFNIEGLTTSPDNSAAYVAFRAPISPASARTKALIVPVTNFAALVSANPTTGPATFGAPIQLDLGGRGIREIKKNSANEYLIIAGPAMGSSGANDFKFYTWTGVATDVPVLRAADLSGLTNSGSSPESIVELPAPLTDASSIQLLTDNGDLVYYNDGVIAKDLTQNNFKKSRSDFATLGAALIPTLVANPTTLTNFTTLTGVASAPQVYTLTGSNLTASASVSAPAGFEVSTNGTSFSTSATVVQVSGAISQTIAVRLASTITVGPVSGTITNVSGSATATVTVSGTVNAQPTLTANPTTLSGFTATQGTASASQSYTLLALNLPGSITITAPAGVAVSSDNTTFGPTLTLPQATTSAVVFTRLTAASAGAVSGTITNVSGSLSATVAVTGTVNAVVVSTTAVSLNALCTPYTQDFNTLATTGVTNTLLPTGWFLAEMGSNNNGQYAANDGNLNTGNTYSYGATGSTERSFGGLQSGSLTPTIGAAFVNNTGATITSLEISYTGKQWRLGAADRPDRLDFQYNTSATSLTTATGWTDVDQLDFQSPVTTGVGAKDGNDPNNQANISYTITGLSLVNGATLWIRFNDFNASGADDGLAVDDFSATPGNSGTCSGLSATPNPLNLAYVVSAGPASQTLTVTGANLSPAAGTVSVTSSSTAILVSYNGSAFSSSASIPYSSSALSTTLGVQLVAGLSAGSYPASVSFAGGGALFNLTVTGTVSNTVAAGPLTLISAIQGTGTTAALTGARTIEGIVTRVFAGAAGLNGFYVQEEDADSDNNPATSEGISVFDPTGQFTGNVGDKVRLTATAGEFTSSSDGVNSSLTQMTNITNLVNLGASTLPTVTTVAFPVTNVTDLERFESMLVTIRAASGNLTVTEHFNLGRFGQITLAATDASNQPGTDPRIDQFTQFTAPSVSGFTAYQAATARREIILDDGSGVQNPAIIIHARGGNPLSASNTLRGGDDVASITGILDERFDGYRVQTNVPVNFNAANPRPTTIPNVGGSLKVAGANVLNFFNGPTFPTSRGADNAAELTRQRSKIVTNLIGTGADVVALSEIENDGYGASSAIQDLVNALNTATNPGTWTFVNAGTTSTDEITVALIYKPGSVSAVGAAVVIPNSYGNSEFDVVGRKPIAQTFRQTGTGGILTVVANHWKSKGSSSPGSGNVDAGDGQGNSNGTRTRQAQDLLQWLGTNPTGTTDPDYLILGDLNAYAQEQPITTLTNSGYSALLANTSYSFAFRGEWGSLDHALATTALASQVTGATKWYINADEPRALDYNTEFKTAGQVSSLYAADQFRSADHDPLVVGLNLTGPLTATLVASTSAVCPGTPVNFSATVAGLGTGATYALTITNGTNQTTASGLSASAVTVSVTPTVPGAFTLTVLTSTALTTSAVSGSITINAVPTNASLTSGTLTCSQTSVTLTASATDGTSYTFSGGTPLGNNQVVVSAGGNYTVTVSNVSGCTASATATVSSSINAPTAPTYTLTNNGTVCVGTELVVTANGCNSGTVSFTISPYTGSGVTASPSYTFQTTAQPGTYTICAICTNSTGCSSPMALTTVTIAPLPSAMLTASSSVFCSGNSVTLTASGGTNYAFTGPSTQNSTSPVFVVTQAGTYTVVVTNAAGCSNTATVTISVLLSAATFTLPASVSTVCEGSSFSLPVTVSGSGTMFQWYRNGVLLANQTSATLTLGSVQLSDAGTYSLVINGGCGNNGNSGSSPFILTVNPLPTITLIFPGGILTNSLPTIQLPTPGQVLVQASGGVSYDWTLVIDRINGYEIRKVLTNANGLFTIDQPGPYRVTVTGANGCRRTVAGTIVN